MQHNRTDDCFTAIIKSDIYVDWSTLTTKWDDISGLSTAKQALEEAAIKPLLRPDIFRGPRSPSGTILLYGPPGTGKKSLVKALARKSQSVFFCCSASALMSKYSGESPKLVQALFKVATDVAPSIIFLDGIDSLLRGRDEYCEDGGVEA